MNIIFSIVSIVSWVSCCGGSGSIKSNSGVIMVVVILMIVIKLNEIFKRL